MMKHNNKTLEIPLISSKFHMDVTPCDLKNNDKLIIQHLIKGTASYSQLSSDDQKSFKTIILNEADQLTHQAQASLRRTMEKYVKSCRLILVCENIGNIIPALQSRCLLIRCRAPQNIEIKKILEFVNIEENCNFSDKLLENLSNHSRNLRSCLINMQNEAVKQAGGIQKKEQVVSWTTAIKKMADSIMKDQSAQK